MSRTILIAMLGVLLAGCATQPWLAHKTATVDQLWKDRNACYEEVKKEQKSVAVDGSLKNTVAPKCSAVNDCLLAKGYAKIPSGALEVPIAARMRCVE